jgi:hypothetical protein
MRMVCNAKGVKAFREQVLSGKLLSPVEADRLVASPAEALIPHPVLEKVGTPLVDHTAEILARD